MPIRVRSDTDFKKLLGALAGDLVDAHVFFKLHADLLGSLRAADEFKESRTFWSMTLQAHYDATIFRLCRIFDQYPGSLNLSNFLETIQENLKIFEVDSFRDRLKGNPFVDSLAQNASQPNADQLAKDILFASIDNKLVKRVVDARNNFYAHRSSRDVINAADLEEKYGLSTDEVWTLLNGGVQVINRYSNLFHAQVYATNMIGHDDYEYVLNVIRADLEAKRAALAQEMERFGKSD